jgi:hypothetical protein
MNRDEQFEQRLRRQQLREVPSAWKKEILSHARETHHASPSTHPDSSVGHLLWTLKRRFFPLLSPHPRAWGALGAVWVVIIAANLASHDDAGATGVRAMAPPPEIREMLKQQEQLLTELVGERPGVDRRKVVDPARPHSHRRDEFQSA